MLRWSILSESPSSYAAKADSKTLPRLDNLVILARLYDVPIDELVALKTVRTENLPIRGQLPPPYGIADADIEFIKCNASEDVQRALGQRFFLVKSKSVNFLKVLL